MSASMKWRYLGHLRLLSRPLLLRRPPKKPIFGFGRRKTAVFRSAPPKKKRRPKILGAAKKNWRVEKAISPPNTITRRRRKKKTRFFRLGAEKYDFWAPKEQRPTIFRSAEKKIGGRNFFSGGRKSYSAAEHHTWAPKNTTLGRLRSKSLLLSKAAVGAMAEMEVRSAHKRRWLTRKK